MAKKPDKKEKKDTVTFSLTLPADLCRTIDAEADRQMRSRHAQTVWILGNYLRQYPRHPSILEAIHKAGEQY